MALHAPGGGGGGSTTQVAFTSAILGEYKVSTNTTPPPNTGYLEYNNATQTSATVITVHDETQDGININIFLSLLSDGSTITIQDKNDHLNYQIWEISGAPTDNTTYWSFPVTLNSSGGTGTTGFANNHEVFIAAFGGGVTLPLSLANGGSGASNEWTVDSANGAHNDLVLTTNSVKFTGTSVSVTGINAGGIDGRRVILYNNNVSSQMTIAHLSASSLAANRIFVSTAANLILRPNHGIELHYSAADGHWHTNIPWTLFSVGAPLVSNTLGQISMPSATAARDGYLTQSDFSTFAAKLSSSGGAANRIPYYTSATAVTGEAALNYDAALERVGIQKTAPEAPLHVASTVGQSINDTSAFTATLIQWSNLAVPNGSSATQIAGRLMNPDSPVATEDASGTSPYSGGDGLTYRIAPYDGNGNFSVQYTETTPVTLTGSNGVDISWSDDNSGSEAIAGYYVLRDLNGGGFTDFVDVGLVSAWNDDGSAWAPGGFGSAYDDYIANGTARSYTVYSKKTNAGGDTFSPSGEAYGMTDDNSGKPYRVSHTIVGYEAGGSARVIGAADGTSADSYIDGVTFSESNGSWTAGTTVTPNSLGYTSDGSILNRNYYVRNFYTYYGTDIYSGNDLLSATSDPNDSNIYYIQLTASPTGTRDGVKFFRDADQDTTYDAGEKITSAASSITYYDTGDAFGAEFTSGTNSSPTSFVVEAIIGERGGTALTDPAAVIARGTADYSRFEIQDSNGLRIGFIEANQTECKLGADGNPVIRMNTNQLGLFNVTPITRPTTGHGAASFTANSGTAVNDASTFDGYTIKQVVKALRDLGVLT